MLVLCFNGVSLLIFRSLFALKGMHVLSIESLIRFAQLFAGLESRKFDLQRFVEGALTNEWLEAPI